MIGRCDVRTFIALELNEETKSYIKKISGALEKYVNGNYISDINVHMTMNFLGELQLDRIKEIREIMDHAQEKCGVCDISLQKLIVMQRGELIAVTVKLNESVRNLYTVLTRQLSARGFVTEDRAFKPHVTLVRKAVYEMPFREIVKCVPVYNRPQRTGKLTLFLSEMREKVRVYDELYSVTLQDKTDKTV